MRTFTLSALVLIAWTVFSPPLSALECRASGHPAATVLYPYFEVDLANPAGATTLISITNTVDEPTLANVVLWTDCGFPALSFFVYLPGGAVQSLNLRLVLSGQLPSTGPGEGGEPFPGCSDPIEPPVLDAGALSTLRARFAGEPDPDDGLCYGSHRPASQLAVGYVTVDAVSGCSDTLRTPLDEGYFAAGGGGLATNDNVLWGDFFLVDPEGDAAQGTAAVSLVADAGYFADNPYYHSFYDSGDDRYSLGARYRTRHLNGGGFNGGTDLILWFGRGLFPAPIPNACEDACRGASFMTVTERDESGNPVAESFVTIGSMAARVKVGSERLPVAGAFGTLDFWADQNCPVCSPPLIDVSSWVMPIYTAQGRFSVGLPALQLGNPCG